LAIPGVYPSRSPGTRRRRPRVRCTPATVRLVYATGIGPMRARPPLSWKENCWLAGIHRERDRHAPVQRSAGGVAGAARPRVRGHRVGGAEPAGPVADRSARGRRLQRGQDARRPGPGAREVHGGAGNVTEARCGAVSWIEYGTLEAKGRPCESTTARYSRRRAGSISITPAAGRHRHDRGCAPRSAATGEPPGAGQDRHSPARIVPTALSAQVRWRCGGAAGAAPPRRVASAGRRG
jgi:hypothetical protein